MTENGEMEVIVKFFTLFRGIALTLLLSGYVWSAQEAVPCSSPALKQIQAYTLQCENSLLKKGDKSNCLISAENLFKFFNSQEKPWERFDALQKFQSPKDNEYVGILNWQFFEKLITTIKESHALIYVNLFGSHALVIEKTEHASGADGWRVYQSSQSLFTLSQWLCEKPLKVLCAQDSNAAETYKHLHHDYGSGKVLTTRQLTSFFMVLSDIFRDVSNNAAYSGIFKITNTQPALILQPAQEPLPSNNTSWKKTGLLIAGITTAAIAAYKAKPLLCWLMKRYK
jgi:hypothetical protein